jgi:hypothetical protein
MLPEGKFGLGAACQQIVTLFMFLLLAIENFASVLATY